MGDVLPLMEEKALSGEEETEQEEDTSAGISLGCRWGDVLPLMEEEELVGLDGDGEDGESPLERC